MMLFVLEWMPQLPQHEYNIADKQVVLEVDERFEFRDITGSTKKCYSNSSTFRVKPWKNSALGENDTKVLSDVLNDINIDTSGVDFTLTMNASDVSISMHRVPIECRGPLLNIVMDGVVLSQEQVSQYMMQGMLTVHGIERQKKEMFEPSKELSIDSDMYEEERERLNISKAFEALPRTSFWRHGSDYLSTNKMSLKKRLVESEVKRVVLGEFEYDNGKVGTIYGMCLPQYTPLTKQKCELLDFQTFSAGVEIIIGCTRLCQLRSLSKSVYNDALNSAVVICE